MSSKRESVRRSPFAGTWYPGRKDELDALVSGFLSDAETVELPGRLIALVSPHAGLVYSGRTAAAGYRLLLGSACDTVVLLGPSHRVWFDGLSVFSGSAFETPLGRIPVDEELAALVESEMGRDTAEALDVHRGEHCLEMQLPFLQCALDEFRIVPMVMGEQSPRNIEAATRALVRAGSAENRRVLLVASSDLSHYESRARAQELDGRVLDCLERFAPDDLLQLLERERRHACGGGPMVSVLRAARELGATGSKVLRYADSGDVTGDTDGVVGYVSAAFFRAA